MLFSPDYLEFDPKKKNKAWLQRIISEFRMSSIRPLYDPILAKKNRDIINSEQNLENIQKMFKESTVELEKVGFKIFRICIIEKIKNILIGEKWKAEIKAYVDAQDPSLNRLKKEDMNLLKSKKMIDKTVNDLKRSIGLPPSPVTNDDFHGNYSDFEAMGFNADEDMDIVNFFEMFHQLDTEIDFQKFINHVFAVNSVEELTHDFVIDALATKTLAHRNYVDKMSGGINFRRILAEDMWVIKGSTKSNQKGDVALGYYETVTVNEFIKRAGDSFSMSTQFEILLQGINSFNGYGFTGIQFGDNTILGDRKNPCLYSELLKYTVQMGYCEFKSIDATNYEEFTNKLGNKKVYELGESIEDRAMDKKKKNEYKIIQDFVERTYQANYLVTGLTENFVIDGGLLYHQETEGQEDEYSAYSLKYIQYSGKTVAEVAEPWVEMAQEAFTKFRYLLRREKPDGTYYNLESLVAVAKQFMGNSGAAGVKAMVEKFDNSENGLYSTPLDKKGNVINIQGGINQVKKNGFDSKFPTYKDIVTWAVDMVKNDLGMNDLREGANQKTNDVYKLQQAALESSSNATYYLDNMFDWTYKNGAISILSFMMDIARFKDSIPYKYMLSVIGELGMKRLENLGKISPHRMDIFVSSFANVQDRINVLRDTKDAYMAKLIDYATKVLIDNTNDPRKAQKLLVIKEQRGIKLQQQQLQQDREFQMAMIKEKTNGELAIVDARGGWEFKKMQAQAEGFIRAAQINADAKGAVEDKKAAAEKESSILEHQAEQQKAFGVS